MGSFLCSAGIARGRTSDQAGSFLTSQVLPRGKVAVARGKGFLQQNGSVDQSLLQQAIHQGLMALTREETPSSAWSRLFRPSDKVGIKLNCLAGRGLSPRPEFVQCLVQGLRLAGIPDENIIIWERQGRELQRAGFQINRDGQGVKCFGTDSLPGGGYESRIESSGSVGSCFSRILSEMCTAVINVPVLKDHDLSGLSGGMKNFYGAIHNPNKYHDNSCDPYIAELNQHRYIKEKVRMTVYDALVAQYHGGPGLKGGWIWPFDGILMSGDPVAVDRIAADIIDEKRLASGMKSLKEEGREPTYIQTAARFGLGEGDPGRIEQMVISVNR